MAIAMIMEEVNTSETSVNLQQTTWHYNPEASHLACHVFVYSGPELRRFKARSQVEVRKIFMLIRGLFSK